jgi:hypothetical protein
MGANALKNLLGFLIICLPLAGCQNFLGIFAHNQPSPEQDTSPGKKLLIDYDKVWEIENCESRKLPYLRLDQSEVVPKTINIGDSIRYRLSYTACVPQQATSIPTRMETKISFEGKTLNTRSDDDYMIETGKWIVDTHIAVPEDARPGTYILDAIVSVKGAMLQDHVSFNVEP